MNKQEALNKIGELIFIVDIVSENKYLKLKEKYKCANRDELFDLLGGNIDDQVEQQLYESYRDSLENAGLEKYGTLPKAEEKVTKEMSEEETFALLYALMLYYSAVEHDIEYNRKN